MTRHGALAVLVAAAAACASKKDPPPTTCGTHAPVVTATATPTSVVPGAETVQLGATSTDADDACLAAPEARVYLWRFESRPPASGAVISDPGSPAPTLLPDVPGTYQLSVVAIDAAGHESLPDFVTVSASGCSALAPSVSLAGPIAGTVGNPVTLPAPAVSDGNCLATGTPTYRWTLVSRPAGSSAVVSDPTAARPVLVPDVAGPYQLAVVATSSAGIESQPAFVVVDAGPCGAAAPVLPALVASPSSPDAGDLVTVGLAGPITDPNEATCGLGVRPYRYRWAIVSSPPGSGAVLTSDGAAGPSFVADVPNAVYQLALTVTDALGNESAPAFLPVRTSSCGANVPVVAFQAPAVAGDANVPVALSLGVTDADDSAACAARFAVGIARVDWAVVGQPAGSHPALAASSTVPGSAPAFASGNTLLADVPGEYVVEAVATAANGLRSAPQRVTVTLSACGSHPPEITSLTVLDRATGGPVSRPLVGEAVTVAATVFDADASGSACGPAMTGAVYLWSLASRPAGSAVVAPAGPQGGALAFTPDVAGTYVWSVVAVDPQGLASAPAAVTVPTGACGPTIAADPAITVSPAAPAAGTPVRLAVAAPPSSACVAGGAPPSLSWSLTSRPAGSGAALLDPSSAAPSFTPDVPGTYAVRLVVTDGGGFSSVYDAAVNAGGCTPPAIVNGATQPLGAASLLTVTDPDLGVIPSQTIHAGARVSLALPLAASGRGGLVPGSCGGAGLEWSILSRPSGSQAQLSSTTAATPAFVADVPNGTYQLAVLARDGQGNASAPFFFTLATTGCGAFPPSLGGSLSFSPAPRANLAFTATAPPVIDGNASCPARFQGATYTYAFSVASMPAGAAAQVRGAGSTAEVTVTQGGSYGVQVVATSSLGLSTPPLTTNVAVSGCGAYPPVATAFSVAQGVPASGGGTAAVADTVATGATATAGGAASSARGYYVGLPVQVSAAIADADAGAGCAGFGVPSQPASYAWTLVQAPAGSRASASGSGPAVAFTPDVRGAYTLSLTTTDTTGAASTGTVTLSAGCGDSAPAIAALSGTQTVPSTPSTLTTPAELAVGQPVSLGAVVVDPDASALGACAVAEAQPPTYQWSFAQLPPGSAATLLGASTARPSFVPDVATNATGSSVPYVLTLTVTDPQGHAASSQLAVSVTCDAAAPAVATVGGSAGTPDFTVTQTLAGVTGAGAGTHSLQLRRGSNPSSDLALLDGIPFPAVPFYPGFPLQLAANVPSIQTSAGCGAYEQRVTYAWSILSRPAGSTAQLSGAAERSPSFTPDLPGAYELKLVLTDQAGRTSEATLALDTNASEVLSVGACGTHAPTVVANVTGPIPAPLAGIATEPLTSRTQLDATGTLSVDATPFPAGCGLDRPLSYAWSLVSTPAGSAAQLSSATVVDPWIVLDQPGTYTIALAVSDGTKVARKTLSVNGGAGFTSQVATTGPVFTATTTDGSGKPVVAWWDNGSGTVGAARCTSGCDTATPTWSSLGTVDSGLGPMTFAAEDDPRPLAVAVSGSTTYVAYFTSHAPGLTTGLHGVAPCNVAVAVNDGTSWVSWTTVDGRIGNSCTADGSEPYANYEFGRWLSMALRGGSPVVAYWSVVGSTATELEYGACTSPACTAFATGVVAPWTSPTSRHGRWASLVVDAAGAMNVAYRVDDDGTGAGARGLRLATDASGAFASTDVETSTTVDAGRFSSIAAIPANPPAGPPGAAALVIAYRDSSADVAKLARCTETGSGCTFGAPVVIPDAVGTGYGEDVTIAVDPSTGSLRLAYLDAAHGTVRVRQSSDGSAFGDLAALGAASAANVPLGLSIAFGAGTGVAYSQTATGPLVFYSGP